MTHNLKALGLALLAAFALSAVAATAASAHTPAKFTSGSATTLLTAESIADPINHQLIETAGGDEITCKKIKLDETHVAASAETITAKPTYEECIVNPGNFTAQVHLNGCHYLLTAATQMHITCPPNKEIEMTAFILGQFRPCLDIPAQTPTKSEVHYTNKTYTSGGTWKWDVEVTSTIDGITYTKTGLCGNTEKNDMKLTGAFTVKGENPVGGAAIDVTWDATVA